MYEYMLISECESYRKSALWCEKLYQQVQGAHSYANAASVRVQKVYDCSPRCMLASDLSLVSCSVACSLRIMSLYTDAMTDATTGLHTSHPSPCCVSSNYSVW
jgi:hypothetical protein